MQRHDLAVAGQPPRLPRRAPAQRGAAVGGWGSATLLAWMPPARSQVGRRVKQALEDVAEVLEQVPPVGNLHRGRVPLRIPSAYSLLRSRLTMRTRVRRQPGGEAAGAALWEEVDRTAALQVDQHGAVGATPPAGPRRRPRRRARPPAGRAWRARPGGASSGRPPAPAPPPGAPPGGRRGRTRLVRGRRGARVAAPRPTPPGRAAARRRSGGHTPPRGRRSAEPGLGASPARRSRGDPAGCGCRRCARAWTGGALGAHGPPPDSAHRDGDAVLVDDNGCEPQPGQPREEVR